MIVFSYEEKPAGGLLIFYESTFNTKRNSGLNKCSNRCCYEGRNWGLAKNRFQIFINCCDWAQAKGFVEHFKYARCHKGWCGWT